MEPRLRVKPLPPPPEKRKVSFRLPEPVLAIFDTYLALYKETYGEEPNQDFVVEQIFSSFFESDRAFVAYLKKGSEPEEVKRKKERKKTAQASEAVQAETAQL